ncbi:hypothetical protein TIFTF001_019324 [Ficus carica]|uniref:Uncharacterized protein n=1 Tax=Ficus carica TaxID=3494 RepID=A0AA88AE52_FICCA|nr:hypothetical protein TIFTF001_019324 [Ficus carica]
MAGSWERTVESVMFNGLRTVCTVSCWVVTATLAYFLWVKPSQDQQKGNALAAFAALESDPHRYIPKMKPISDPNIYSLWLKAKQEQQMISNWTPSDVEGTTLKHASSWS